MTTVVTSINGIHNRACYVHSYGHDKSVACGPNDKALARKKYKETLPFLNSSFSRGFVRGACKQTKLTAASSNDYLNFLRRGLAAAFASGSQKLETN